MRYNNFDLARFCFSVSVFFIHTAILTKNNDFAFFKVFLSPEVPVQAFFIISGYLIIMSFNKDTSLFSYINKRIRRIYPAYLVVILVSVVIGGLVSTYNVLDYTAGELLRYFLANITFMNFLQPCLPGVFTENNNCAVNGSLWTIKVEVMFYCTVPVIVFLIRKFNPVSVIAALYVLSLLWKHYFLNLSVTENDVFFHKLAIQLPGQLSFFMVGAMLYYYPLKSKVFTWLLVVSVMFFVVESFYSKMMIVSSFLPIFLGITVIYFVTEFKYLGRFGKYGDFSYGVYIWHYPVIQTFIYFGLYESSLSGLILSALCVLFLAVISWYYIEKPFLLKSSHYVKETVG